MVTRRPLIFFPTRTIAGKELPKRAGAEDGSFLSYLRLSYLIMIDR